MLQKKFEFLMSLLRENKPIDSFRLLNGRGKTFAGYEFVNVDFFQPVLLLTCYREPPTDFVASVIQFWAERMQQGMSCVLLQRRYLLSAPTEVLLGDLPAEVFAARRNLFFHLHLNAQQNIGYFLDMEAGRQWLDQHSHGKRILNLFAYTCALSVVAIAAGAEKVVNVDMSSAALNLGRANHQRNNFSKTKSEFVAENILKSWSRIKKHGPYDLVVIDPPSFQKGSFIAEKDYAKVVRRLPELMPQGGLVMACLNAPELGTEFLMQLFAEVLPSASLIERLKPHPDFPDVDAEQQLKVLIYKLNATDDLSPA